VNFVALASRRSGCEDPSLAVTASFGSVCVGRLGRCLWEINRASFPFGYKRSIFSSGSMVFGDHPTGSAEQPVL
jgi:hypothetical protein